MQVIDRMIDYDAPIAIYVFLPMTMLASLALIMHVIR